MRRSIALFIIVALCIGLVGCFQMDNIPKNTHNQATEGPKYDTAYPDAVLVAEANVITVEKATEDLFENMHHKCLQVGVVTFDNLTLSYPDLGSIFPFNMNMETKTIVLKLFISTLPIPMDAVSLFSQRPILTFGRSIRRLPPWKNGHMMMMTRTFL